MQRFNLGSVSVARIGFGAMQLPGPGVFGPPRDRAQALAVLRRAVELGVDHIDTAQFYGPDVANELIREALHPYPERLALVSKVGARRDAAGAWLPALAPEDLRSDIEANLSALGVERLAVVNLRLADTEPGQDIDALFEQQLTTIVQARDEGLIGGIGLSNCTLTQLRYALERTEIACVQNAFNVLDRSTQPVIDECTAREIAFVPFFPLGSGFSAHNPVLENTVVQGIAADLGRTPAQVVLAWTLGFSPTILLIPGTSSIEHLEQNMAVGDITLDESARRRLDALA